MAPIVSPVRKLQGDNPDALYHFARIRGDRTYRIFGTVREECYTSFTIHGKAPDGAMAGPLLGDINNRDFDVNADGTYELFLSATPGPGMHDRNWLRLDAAAHSVVVRSYYQLPVSAQNDPAISVCIGIECLDEVGLPGPLTDAALAERMGEGIAFIRQASLSQATFGNSSPVPFVSNVPNTLPVPFSFRNSGLPVPGAADIWYSMGRYRLDPDEALLITGTLPTCVFVNVMLWNKHMQTMEYRNRQSSLNQAQLALEADGSFRIVVAHTDPGVANWLDTEGHREGSIFWRFLLPEYDPAAINCEVVPLSNLLAG
jgi:hypothetical protein